MEQTKGKKRNKLKQQGTNLARGKFGDNLCALDVRLRQVAGAIQPRGQTQTETGEQGPSVRTCRQQLTAHRQMQQRETDRHGQTGIHEQQDAALLAHADIEAVRQTKSCKHTISHIPVCTTATQTHNHTNMNMQTTHTHQQQHRRHK